VKKLPTLLLLLLLPFLMRAQAAKTDSVEMKPTWWVAADLFNWWDNYPALLLSAERHLGQDFGLHLEVGPIFVPEAFFRQQFESYFGFKSRLAGRFYYKSKPEKGVRHFIAVDFGYNRGRYKMEYDLDFGEYSRIETGIFHRHRMSYHFRWGNQRFLLASERMVFEWSLGVGRRAIWMDEPDSQGAFIITNDDILRDHRDSIIGPVSANIRVKIGYVLK